MTTLPGSLPLFIPTFANWREAMPAFAHPQNWGRFDLRVARSRATRPVIRHGRVGVCFAGGVRPCPRLMLPAPLLYVPVHV